MSKHKRHMRNLRLVMGDIFIPHETQRGEMPSYHIIDTPVKMALGLAIPVHNNRETKGLARKIQKRGWKVLETNTYPCRGSGGKSLAVITVRQPRS